MIYCHYSVGDKLKKVLIGIVLLIILIILLVNIFTSNSLEKAINNKHSTSIEILIIEPKKKLVLFKEQNSNLIMVNNYKKLYDRYFYSTKGEEAISVNALDSRIPFTIRVSKIEGIGNVVWGFIASNAADKIIINFKKGEEQFILDESLNGRGFIFYPPEIYKNKNFYDEKWLIEGYVLDKFNTTLEYY